MALTRRELIGYAVAGTTGMGITAAARRDQPDDPDTAGIQRYWQLGGVHARPATIEESAITFRASASSSFDTNYNVRGDAYRLSVDLVDVTADGSVRVYVNGTER